MTSNFISRHYYVKDVGGPLEVKGFNILTSDGSNNGSYHLLVTSRSDDYFLRSDGHLRSDEQMVEVIRSDRHFK